MSQWDIHQNLKCKKGKGIRVWLSLPCRVIPLRLAFNHLFLNFYFPFTSLSTWKILLRIFEKFNKIQPCDTFVTVQRSLIFDGFKNRNSRFCQHAFINRGELIFQDNGI